MSDPKSLLYELITPLGRRPRLRRFLYRLRELIDVPLSVSARASSETVGRAATAVAITRVGRLEEALGPVQRNHFGKHQQCFTPSQWQEVCDQAEEAIGWFEEDAKREARLQERRREAKG